MKKGKIQRYKAGAILKVALNKNKFIFARLLPGLASIVCVYDFMVNENVDLPTIDEIVKKPILFCCGLYRTIITKRVFEIIGYKDFSEEEISSIPPSFTQKMVNINDCVIFWPTGGERIATPQECIGLERSAVWDEKSLIERIEDYYSGKKNYHVEQQKVILSKEDPRYLAPPQTLRWDFEKQEFYRTDKL